MARAQRKRRNVDTWKQKSWYEIVAPKSFNEAKIGETVTSDPENLKGRFVKASMMDITGDFSKQHIKLEFKLGDVVGDKVQTEFVGQYLSRDYMRSQIRRKSTRVEDVVDVNTKDGHKIRVKSIAMAIGRAQATQEKAIRKIMRDIVIKRAQALDLEQFINEVIKGRLSANIYRGAGKIYSIKRVEIRKVRVLEDKKRSFEK
ncbi:30S ribosomal protein S3ae [archaeon]|nr:30S ribosomal protein S3ae [archaeon]